MNGVLVGDLVSRAPTRDDAQAVTDLIIADDFMVTGQKDFDLHELLNEWDAPWLDLERDTRIVVTPQGQVVGYETVFVMNSTGRLITDGHVHPDYRGQGIGTYLLNWSETRAREHISEFPDDQRVFLQASIFGKDEGALPLLKSQGFAVVRHFWRMEIDMTEAPAVPTLPAGMTIRAFVRGQDERATWQATSDAFRDHWGSAPLPFDDWIALKIHDDFDPSLWFLAMDGDQIAGVSLCNNRMGNGWVATLGVQRPWRRVGLGMALLQHSFAEFYRRGKANVGLVVDAQSLTGATRLYERAGMHIAERFDTYEKELRPGR